MPLLWFGPCTSWQWPPHLHMVLKMVWSIWLFSGTHRCTCHSVTSKFEATSLKRPEIAIISNNSKQRGHPTWCHLTLQHHQAPQELPPLHRHLLQPETNELCPLYLIFFSTLKTSPTLNFFFFGPRITLPEVEEPPA